MTLSPADAMHNPPSRKRAFCNQKEDLNIMELKIYPAGVLLRSAAPLRQVTEKELSRLHAMLDVMYASGGIGLAGPQVGWGVRVVTMDIDGSGQDERIFINPVILESEGLEEEEEGCLSLPGMRCLVPRAGRVVVAAYTADGKRLERDVSGLEARAWQHEIDHLNGVLFIDKISGSARLGIRRYLKTLQEDSNSFSRRSLKKN